MAAAPQSPAISSSSRGPQESQPPLSEKPLPESARLPLHKGDVEALQTVTSNGNGSNQSSRTRGGSGDSGVINTAGSNTLVPPPIHHHHRRPKWRDTMPRFVRPEGESGRNGFHPGHFLRITFRSASLVSRAVNVLWPVVPAAIAVAYTPATKDKHLLIFILSYVAMVPCANLVGFAGQELARKVSHVYGVLVETTFGSIVEIIMFLVLLTRPQNLVPVIQAAILGSVLATMLLCLGLCFLAAGVRREETHHNEAISEAGSGLLLTAGLALAIPAIFKKALAGGTLTDDQLSERTLAISRITAILLLLAYSVFIYYQAKTHHGIYDAIFEGDEQRDNDRGKDQRKDKLTLLECVLALCISIALVTAIAITLVDQIEHIVAEQGISDSFMGLILVPLVEKAAEHLTAVDEAWDNQMNFALSHVLGATLQTALFNAPLVVLVGWGIHRPMGLEFQIFDVAVLILAIITVGNFLRDGKSNYLEGFLCVIVYIAIAVAAFHYPNPHHVSSHGSGGESTTDAHR